MKQETLYESFLNCLIDKEFKTKEDYIAFKGAEFGAKWQQERSYSEKQMDDAYDKGFKDAEERNYSEEEIMTILYCFHYDLVNSNIDTKEEWFKQFKKK